MNRKYTSLILLLFIIISCTDSKQTIDINDYNRATKHLPQNLNKFVANNLISQKWENDVLYYRTKNDTVFKSFLIDVNNLEIKEGIYPFSNNTRRSYLEFISPNGKKSIYIKNYNLWIKDLITKKTKQLTFDGYEDYGYGINNAGWIKNDKIRDNND